MFNVSVERFGGGVFLDGLDSNGQNQEITLRSNNMSSDVNNVVLNPPQEPINTFKPEVCLQEDCFWYCTLDQTGRPNVEFVRGSRVGQLLRLLGIRE
jgi:hypothetical protein